MKEPEIGLELYRMMLLIRLDHYTCNELVMRLEPADNMLTPPSESGNCHISHTVSQIICTSLV